MMAKNHIALSKVQAITRITNWKRLKAQKQHNEDLTSCATVTS